MTNLLEGEVLDPLTQELDALRAENRRLRREADDARVEADRAREDANRALSMLRRQLGPLYRALQAVFGELDTAGVTDEAAPVAARGENAPPVTDARVAAVWASWKSRLGGGASKVIDALLVHSDLNTQQLAIATGLHRTTIPKLIYELNKAGLINKNGGRFSLKQL